MFIRIEITPPSFPSDYFTPCSYACVAYECHAILGRCNNHRVVGIEAKPKKNPPDTKNTTILNKSIPFIGGVLISYWQSHLIRLQTNLETN